VNGLFQTGSFLFFQFIFHNQKGTDVGFAVRGIRNVMAFRRFGKMNIVGHGSRFKVMESLVIMKGYLGKKGKVL